MVEVVDGRVQLLVSMTDWSRGRDTLLSSPDKDGSRDVDSLDDSITNSGSIFYWHLIQPKLLGSASSKNLWI